MSLTRASIVAVALALGVAGCAGQKLAITDSFADFSAQGQVKLVGTLEYGQSRTIAYHHAPRYAAYKFYGRAGESVTLDVKSPADAVAWITDGRFKIIAQNDDASTSDRDSHIELTLPPSTDADHVTYYAIVREYAGRDASFTVSLAAPAHDTGAWHGKSVYFVMTDRYSNGDTSNDDANGFPSNLADPSAWHGGDFRGLSNKLDYIAGMGFTALWITPVVTQHSEQGYHGYYGWDWSRIDGHLGDMNELASLVEAAHARGISVLIDTVANHTGRYDYRAPSFPERSMYHHNGDITNWSDPNQLQRFDLQGLNDLDQDNPSVRQALLDHVRRLIASTGADALRVDTVKHVPITFWVAYSAAAGVFTLGEVFDGEVSNVAPFSRALDATLDYPLYFQIKNVFALGQSARRLGTLFAQDGAYRDPLLNGVFADNHDQPRFGCNTPAGTSAADRDRDLRLALAFTFTVRGIPILYYGTEQGLASCTNNREDMTRFDANAPLYAYVAQLNKARNAALRLGPQRERWQDDTAYAFERESGQSVALVAFNLGSTTRTLTMKHMHAPAGTVLTDAMGGAATATIGSDLSVTVTVPARSVLILTAS